LGLKLPNRSRFQQIKKVSEAPVVAGSDGAVPVRVSRFFAPFFGVLRYVFKRILFVCIGNICRSPTAEYVLRQRLGDRDMEITSAGLGALVGHPVERHAMSLLTKHGMDASSHRARQLEVGMLRDAELVLAMERRQLASIARLAPESSGKLFLLDKWLDAGDVPDPYRQPREVFENVYSLIERGVGSWLRYL
jgi:protein-tyrosine phosphatase